MSSRFQFRPWVYKYEDDSIPAFGITSTHCNRERVGCKGRTTTGIHSHVIRLDYVTFLQPWIPRTKDCASQIGVQ